MILLPPRTTRRTIEHFTGSLGRIVTGTSVSAVAFLVNDVVRKYASGSVQLSKRLYKALASVPVVIFLVAAEWDDECVVLNSWSVHPSSLSQGSRLFNWWQKLKFLAELHPAVLYNHD
jgi:hypothetical protein